jgi:hypothetical protein
MKRRTFITLLGRAPAIGLRCIAGIVAFPAGDHDVAGHGLTAGVAWDQVISELANFQRASS